MNNSDVPVTGYEVRARFPKGAVVGTWTSKMIANEKFTEWIELYARSEVTVTLTVRMEDGSSATIRRWPEPAADPTSTGGIRK